MNQQRVVILGEEDTRWQIRETLKGNSEVDIIGELCAFHPRHVDFLAAERPEFVVVDGAARSINLLLVIAELRALPVPPKVIVVLDAVGPIDYRAVSRLGIDAIVTTRQALRAALHVSPIAAFPLTAGIAA